MKAILTVATNTVRQVVRQRLYFNLITFGVVLVFFAVVVGNLTFGYTDRVVRSIGLAGVSFVTCLMALLVGVSLINQEIERKTLFVILSRPLSRWQYLVGRFLGLTIAMAGALVGLSALFLVVLLGVGGSITTLDLMALILVLPEAAIVGAIGTTLSTFSTPTLSSGIGLGLWFAGTAVDDLYRLTRDGDALVQAIGTAANYALPNLARFDIRDAAIYGDAIDSGATAIACGYGVIYCAMLLAIGSAILSRREMI